MTPATARLAASRGRASIDERLFVLPYRQAADVSEPRFERAARNAAEGVVVAEPAESVQTVPANTVNATSPVNATSAGQRVAAASSRSAATKPIEAKVAKEAPAKEAPAKKAVV